MLPTVVSDQVRQGINYFLGTSFSTSGKGFQNIIHDFLEQKETLFKGPFISLKLPFETGGGRGSKKYFPQVLPKNFSPYFHQEESFDRLKDSNGKSTLIATGTGSGKTECFLYPILDHCYQQKSLGIKAILIYPMNALATDQVKRIAKTISENPNLKHLRVGLFIGGKSDKLVKKNLVTNREELLKNPPDILLTNYKMLDYLLLRPENRNLWSENSSDTLKYLVVDELHTFDGAQGTDIACLIRRLKERLKTPKNHLTCVGTSATIGGEEDTQELVNYANLLFGEAFDEDSIIVESVQSPVEFFGAALIGDNRVPEDTEPLQFSKYQTYQDYIQAQIDAWFPFPVQVGSENWQVTLGEFLMEHPFFRNLVLLIDRNDTGRGVFSEDALIQFISKRLDSKTRSGVALEKDRARTLLTSFISLISSAHNEAGQPLLQVRIQLWERELRRMVASISSKPQLKFDADLGLEQKNNHLPLVHCRDCGATGWGAIKKQDSFFLSTRLTSFYQHFFSSNPNTAFIFQEFPTNHQQEMGDSGTLCGHCLHLFEGDKHSSCPSCHTENEKKEEGKEEKEQILLPNVYLYQQTISKKNITIINRDCPFCNGVDGLTIVGSRAASLTSVAIDQLYASRYNDDKKLITFSDSVQDAAHRAGFFQARTYRTTFRSALQQFLNQQQEPVLLCDLGIKFSNYWIGEKGVAWFVSQLVHPDMIDWEDYKEFQKGTKFGVDSPLVQDIQKRLEWDVLQEYTFWSQIGRTLEKTTSSIAYIDNALLDVVLKKLSIQFPEEVSVLRDPDSSKNIEFFVLGFLNRVKSRGAIKHPLLEGYIQKKGEKGDFWIVSQKQKRFYPRVWEKSRLPIFLTTHTHKSRFDQFMAKGSWYYHWARKCFPKHQDDIKGFLEPLYKTLINTLVSSGLFFKEQEYNGSVFGFLKSALFVGTDVERLVCDACQQSVYIPTHELGEWDGKICTQKNSCDGHLNKKENKEDYYKDLFANADLCRVRAREHSSLLTRETRESLEEQFIKGDQNDSPNLLSCTPTLEMGIDIGSLSSVILCSVPPSASNYLQRIGRAGRKDGNSFSLTIATGTPHDLYHFEAPEEMIEGKVNPPGCFLNAPAVLERQLTAYCFDRWVEVDQNVKELPPNLHQIFKNLDGDNKQSFPNNFLNHLELHREKYSQGFLTIFQDDFLDEINTLSEDSKKYLSDYIEGSLEGGGLRYKIISSISEKQVELANLVQKRASLTTAIKKERKKTVQDQNFEETLDKLEQEKEFLIKRIHKIRNKGVLEFFTDEGLLPNYAFPEKGVSLTSIIYKKKAKADEKGAYSTELNEYERPSISAIHELAPNNYFYAEGRKVKIDQINLDSSSFEEWRFCDQCSYLEVEGSKGKTDHCPKCGSESWADGGQVQKMLRMKQVIAETSSGSSLIHDDKEERNSEVYHRNILVNSDEGHVEKALYIDDPNYSFGFELLQQASFREVNFGIQSSNSNKIEIAGRKLASNGFLICGECGKVQPSEQSKKNGQKNDPRNHDFLCRNKDLESQDNNIKTLFLYREFYSEAIRILLPITSFGDSEARIQSFIAAFFLGLKKRFKGNIDHIRSTLDEEPDQGYRKKVLYIYDSIPGGTGYLKDLMKGEKPLLEIFSFALDTMRSCGCNSDPEKDGCYRCLYAYRNNYQMDKISRRLAVEVFSSILERQDQLKPIKNIGTISINPLIESELEQKFLEALRRTKFQEKKFELTDTVVKGKPGYNLKAGDER
ncbi:MAG: DEAD/DEAH box helicase domain-containing protein, partial [bacterium]